MGRTTIVRLRLGVRGRGRLGSNERQDRCDDENVYQRDLEKEKPTEPHELVVPEAGQCPAHPHEDENQHGDFREEGGDVEQTADYAAPAGRVSIDNGPVKSAVPGRNRQMPTAEK